MSCADPWFGVDGDSSAGSIIERDLQIAPDRQRELCRWLGRPLDAPGATPWPVVLVPEFIDSALRFPEDIVQVYHRVRWRAPLPNRRATARVEPRWVSLRNGRAEAAIRTSATSDGDLLADGLMVIRTDDPRLTAWGSRDLPACPAHAELRSCGSVVVDEGQVVTLDQVAGTSYRIHRDPGFARLAGHPNALVQTLLLFLLDLRRFCDSTSGSLEMWFRRPVPVGAALDVALGQAAGVAPATVRTYRLLGSTEEAAVARFRPWNDERPSGSADGEADD